MQLDDATQFVKIYGYTLNIAEYLQYKWFELVWYYNPSTLDRQVLGTWCGPVYDVGPGMPYYVLSSKVNMVTRSIVTPIPPKELKYDEIKERTGEYTEEMESLIGNFAHATQNNLNIQTGEDPYESLFDEDSLPDENTDLMDTKEGKENDSPYTEDKDKLINTKVQLPKDGINQEGRVSSRNRDETGMLVGTVNSNPLLDSREYKVEFLDGSYGNYTTNTLIEYLYYHVDD